MGYTNYTQWVIRKKKERTLSWEVMVFFWKELRENWSTEYDQDTFYEIIK